MLIATIRYAPNTIEFYCVVRGIDLSILKCQRSLSICHPVRLPFNFTACECCTRFVAGGPSGQALLLGVVRGAGGGDQ